MPARKPQQRPQEVLDDAGEVTLLELTRTCRVHAEWVMELIEEGVIEPLGPGQPQWRFSATSIVRIQKAQRLQRDLRLNLPGIALALELLDRIETLEARLRAAPPRDDADAQ